jgi:hypothetical protein
LPDEIFRVRSVLPFFATVMVFLLTSTVLVTASPMVKFTTRCWVPYTPPPASNTFVGEYYPDKGTKVGVAMPVSITFNKPIRDKAMVERKPKVTASPAVAGAWSWMKDRNGKDRIDFRPEKYWKSGTSVTLTRDLAGVFAWDPLFIS